MDEILRNNQGQGKVGGHLATACMAISASLALKKEIMIIDPVEEIEELPLMDNRSKQCRSALRDSGVH